VDRHRGPTLGRRSVRPRAIHRPLAGTRCTLPGVADLDLARMRRERFARLQEQLRGTDVDGLLLLGTSTVQYATGADAPAADQSHVFHERPAALVLAGDDAPHLFTPYPEGAPAELDGARVHPPLDGESDAGVLDMAKRLGEALPAGTPRLAPDHVTAPMHFGLP